MITLTLPQIAETGEALKQLNPNQCATIAYMAARLAVEGVVLSPTDHRANEAIEACRVLVAEYDRIFPRERT